MPISQRDSTLTEALARRLRVGGLRARRPRWLGLTSLVVALLDCVASAQVASSPANPGSPQWQPGTLAPVKPSGSAITPAILPGNDPESLRQRAEALARRGRISEALTTVRGLLRANPTLAEYRLMEAQYLGWLGRTATAGSLYRRLMQDLPGNAAAAEGYANTQLWRGDWRESQSAYANALAATSGESITAQLGFQRALLGAGRASAAFRQATELDRLTGNREAEVGLFLASIHAEVDSDDAAFQLSSRPTRDADVRLRQVSFQARRFIARGQKEEGLQLMVREAGTHAQDYNWQVAAGEVFTVGGAVRDAHSYLDRAEQISPERGEALLARAALLRQQGKQRESLAVYEALVRRNPESVPGWLGLSEVAQQRGDLGRAWEALDSAQRVAPYSALVYRERLKIALRQKDERTFTAVLQDYQRAQPADAWVEVWVAKWADARGGAVNAPALQAVLDPLAPDLSSEALRLLRRHSAASPQAAAAVMPRAPTASLQAAAQEKLGQQNRASGVTVLGFSTGYEFATLQDTTGAGARLQEWHEGYLAAYWRRQLGMTVSGEYRTFSRFGTTANQLLLGWNTHVTPSWIVGVEGGAAISGDFIPRWRVGARSEYLFTDELSAGLGVSHLRFADEPVLQVIPGVTWQWHPNWSSHARMYVTHTEPKRGRVNTGFAGLFSTTWQFRPLASTTLSYAVGEENASQLIKGLIGEKNFQSVGVDLKYAFNERFSLQPTYRYEAHNLFDLHAIGLNLQLRY